MLHRRTFEVETTGSRELRNLRPKISDELPQGLNYRVHAYDEIKKTCIVEVWCSDHEILPEKYRKNASDLAELDSKPYIRKVIPSPQPTKPIGAISVSDLVENIGKAGKGIENVDRVVNKIRVNGLQIGFLRSQKTHDTSGREIEEFILDEG